jgi:hypothetical protein
MAADLSFLTLKDDDHGPFLVIAPTRDAYRKFVTDFVTALNSQIAPPASDGFTFHGVAASYWDPQQGTLRPVYTHEYVHAALAEAMRIDNQGEWLHEGLGTYYQMKFHPQANLKQIVQQGLQAPDYMTPLPRLCNGEAISNRRYWQAMTLVELLLSEPKYRQQLPQLIEALRNSKSTNLEPHLKPVLKTDWAQLTDDWRKHCQKHYAVAEPANAADAN